MWRATIVLGPMAEMVLLINTFANRIVGWKVSRSAKTDFVLDALEQALYARKPVHESGVQPSLEPMARWLHSTTPTVAAQYLSIKYTEHLAKAGIEPSVGSVGDAYDNALAETINGLCKTEVIRRRKSWRSIDEVEMETLKWVGWFNNVRGLSRTGGVHPLTLLEPIGNIPPAEAEEAFYANLNSIPPPRAVF